MDLIRTVEVGAVLIIEGNRLLLTKKAPGLLGEGKWKALSGRLLPSESPIEGAMRESFEESGLRVTQLEPRGKLCCFFEGRQEEWIVHLFASSSFEGGLRSSDEGDVSWFSLDELPYDEMWEDDRHLLPHVLKGKKVAGTLY
ncbi:MAG: 8-oxo-dGTP diphosphatase, partial [Candidatus Bathyarchaeota archaeon]